MVTAFFIGATISSLVGCLFYRVWIAALVKYIIDKEYKPPSNNEMKAYIIYVLKKIVSYSLERVREGKRNVRS